jgi:hypothetical protein
MASRKPAPKAAPAGSGSKPISVVLDVMQPKKHSIKFMTSAEDQAFNALYVMNGAHALLGRPDKIKVTIEPIE